MHWVPVGCGHRSSVSCLPAAARRRLSCAEAPGGDQRQASGTRRHSLPGGAGSPCCCTMFCFAVAAPSRRLLDTAVAAGRSRSRKALPHLMAHAKCSRAPIHPLGGEYMRQCVGITSGDSPRRSSPERRVFQDCRPLCRAAAANQFQVGRPHAIVVCDGGTSFWGVDYDVAAKSFSGSSPATVRSKVSPGAWGAHRAQIGCERATPLSQRQPNARSRSAPLRGLSRHRSVADRAIDAGGFLALRHLLPVRISGTSSTRPVTHFPAPAAAFRGPAAPQRSAVWIWVPCLRRALSSATQRGGRVMEVEKVDAVAAQCALTRSGRDRSSEGHAATCRVPGTRPADTRERRHGYARSPDSPTQGSTEAVSARRPSQPGDARVLRRVRYAPLRRNRPACRERCCLKVSTFDDPSLFGGPQMVIFTIDKQAFHPHSGGHPAFERVPG